MKRFALVSALSILGLTSSASAQVFPIPVQRLHAFIGNWPGTAVIAPVGQPALHLQGYQNCQSVADGWAIHCVGQFSNAVFELKESIQGAYDAATDKIHWQVMYSVGPQAFTVTGGFNLTGTVLSLSRTNETPAGTLHESGAWTFLTPTHRVLEINATLNGIPAYKITADVTKSN